jgi:hypothetical protein
MVRRPRRAPLEQMVSGVSLEETLQGLSIAPCGGETRNRYTERYFKLGIDPRSLSRYLAWAILGWALGPVGH